MAYQAGEDPMQLSCNHYATIMQPLGNYQATIRQYWYG
jgi:hypothetical protein